VFLSPDLFSAAEYTGIAACLERHVAEINRGFATPRPPVEYFAGDSFRDRWAGLRSVAYRRGDWSRNPCWDENTSGFRFGCAGAPFALGVDQYGWVRLCVPSTPDRICGRAVGRLSPDGRTATVRGPATSPVCARGAFAEWFGEDRLRFTRDCALPSGEPSPTCSRSANPKASIDAIPGDGCSGAARRLASAGGLNRVDSRQNWQNRSFMIEAGSDRLPATSTATTVNSLRPVPSP
jgi:hypothetical protein